jgi:CubicO group peptidase (beta-lactamase class C family)
MGEGDREAVEGARPGGQIATPGWFEAATTQRTDFPDSDRGYGAQWWTRAEGAQFEAAGIFGQMIHIDPARGLVVVFLASWPTATGRARSDARLAVIDRIKAAL